MKRASWNFEMKCGGNKSTKTLVNAYCARDLKSKIGERVFDSASSRWRLASLTAMPVASSVGRAEECVLCTMPVKCLLICRHTMPYSLSLCLLFLPYKRRERGGRGGERRREMAQKEQKNESDAVIHVFAPNLKRWRTFRWLPGVTGRYREV